MLLRSSAISAHSSCPRVANIESSKHTEQLRRLIAAGFIEPASAAQAPAKFQLTAKAEQVLCERGVGLNEA